MTDQTVSQMGYASRPNDDGESIRVSAEEYMEKYAHDFYEWVDGELQKMSPITGKHDQLSRYLSNLLDACFALNPIGELRRDPFVMRLSDLDVYREPDIQVILNTNPGQLTETAMIGPADICIEIVSPGSVERDYGKKFQEYEKGGVKEYWLFDPIRKSALFRRLNSTGVYEIIQPSAEDIYETPLLPALPIHIPTLWQDPLPSIIAIIEAVRAMLSDQP